MEVTTKTIIMKRARHIIIAIVFLLTITSCKKNFLDVNDNGNLNRQSYVKDLNSMQNYLNGIYVMISSTYDAYYSAAYPELVADNLKPTSASIPLSLQYNWSQQVDDNNATNATSMNQVWVEDYKIIRACNFVVEDIDKYRGENPSRADDIKGKALAIRAFVYFRVANVFSQEYNYTADASHPGIPYISTADITKVYTRQSTAEVYDNMIADLNQAISLMPDTISDCRAMNGPAAKALLARVYLFKADYTNAKNTAIAVANQFPLMTISGGYPGSLFRNKPSSQTEILFQATPVSNSGYLGYVCNNPYLYAPTKDIATILKENAGDVRSAWVKDTLSTQYKVKKFPAGVAGGLNSSADADYYSPLIRSSEIFLTAAEACAKTSDELNARIYLNAIRKRAYPAIADVTATGQALLDSIYKERRKELCFEGIRMFDLQRCKQAVQRTDVLPGNQTLLAYPNDKAIAPIPGQDVNLMGLQQNQGY
jgi:hypothetical protein